MKHKTLLTSALTVLIAGTTAMAMAQSAPTVPAPTHQMSTKSPSRHVAHHRDHGMRHRGFDGMRGDVIGDLRGLERLYLRAGRSKDLAALYREVLTKSQDPRVRDYVYRHLARLQAQPANYDQAIATLRQGLDENLTREASMIATRDKMRAAWLQRHQQAEADHGNAASH